LVMWIVHGVSAEDKTLLAEQFGAASQDMDTAKVSETALLQQQAEHLALTLSSEAAFKDFGDSVLVTAEAKSVRIDLTDMAIRPLFETGRGDLNETGADLVGITGKIISALPYRISVEGHTDSAPISTLNYSNWDLSSERANAARRILETAGVNPARFRGVTGLADTRALIPHAPHLPANRRISIVLWLEQESVTQAALSL